MVAVALAAITLVQQQTWLVDIADTPVLLYARNDADVVDWIAKSTPTTTKEELLARKFRNYHLPSGELYVHQSADRLQFLESRNDFLIQALAILGSNGYVIDLLKIIMDTMVRLLREANYGAGRDVPLRSKAYITPTYAVEMESNGRTARFLKFTRYDRAEDTESFMVKNQGGDQTPTVSGPHQWNLGTPGNLPFPPKREPVVGKLVQEYLMEVESASKMHENLLSSIDKRVAGSDPFGRELVKLSKGQSFASLPPDVQKILRDEAASSYQLNGFASAKEAVEWLENATFKSSRSEPYLSLREVQEDPRRGGGSFPLRRRG